MKATMYKSIKGCQKLVLKVTLHFFEAIYRENQQACL